jgi:hypothetical protein
MTYEIEKRDGLEVYAGDTGLVVLKQDNDFDRDSSFVFIHPDDIPRVIEYLTSTREVAYGIRKDIAREGTEPSSTSKNGAL